MSDRISTTGQIVLEAEACETNSQAGNSTVYVYTGTKERLLAKRTVELGAGASITKLESTGDGNYQLTVTYATDKLGNEGDLPVSVHELENTMEQVDVYNSDVLRGQLDAAFVTVTARNLALVFLKGACDKWEAVETKDQAAMTAAEAPFASAYSGASLALMLNLFRGIAYNQIRHAPQFNSVYRRRITAASYDQVQAAFTGVGQIWTTAEILSFEEVPSLWWFQLPGDNLWLKASPSVNTVAGQKTEILYNYVGCKYAWSGIHQAYGAAVLKSFYP